MNSFPFIFPLNSPHFVYDLLCEIKPILEEKRNHSLTLFKYPIKKQTLFLSNEHMKQITYKT